MANPTSQEQQGILDQIAVLQNLVYALQNQRANPSPSLPQVTQSSINTSIPLAQQVRVLSQKPGPTGIQVTVGFATPSGINSGQIDHYNIWLQLGSNTPAVIASAAQSPVTFTVSSATSSVTGVIGVQSVMKDGTVLAFTQCPTTTLNLSIVPAGVNNQSINLFTFPSTGVNTAIGSSISLSSAGTYLILIGVTAGNHNSTNATLTCGLLQNGVAVPNNFTVFVGANAGQNTISSNVGFYLVTANAGDTIQLYINTNVTGPFDFNNRLAALKQYAS